MDGFKYMSVCEEERFKETYGKYSKMLYYIALRILDDTYMAEDVVQDTFLKVYDRGTIHKFDGCEPEELKKYLAKMVINKSLKVVNERKAESDYFKKRMEMVCEEKPQYTVEMSVEEAIGCRKLMKTIRELPEIYSHALVEHTIHGKSCKDIAMENGIHIETVKKRVYRARSLLKRRLEKSD